MGCSKFWVEDCWMEEVDQKQEDLRAFVVKRIAA